MQTQEKVRVDQLRVGDYVYMRPADWIDLTQYRFFRNEAEEFRVIGNRAYEDQLGVSSSDTRELTLAHGSLLFRRDMREDDIVDRLPIMEFKTVNPQEIILDPEKMFLLHLSNDKGVVAVVKIDGRVEVRQPEAMDKTTEDFWMAIGGWIRDNGNRQKLIQYLQGLDAPVPATTPGAQDGN